MACARGRRILTVALGSFLALDATGLAAQEQPAATPSYVVVVHPDVPGALVPKDLLKQVFLREVDAWGDGMEIVAVDQSMSSAVRKSFSEDVLGRSPQQLLLFWQQQIRRGVKPPTVKKSDAEVIEFVASKSGAIGYVSPQAELDPSVRVLRIAPDKR